MRLSKRSLVRTAVLCAGLVELGAPARAEEAAPPLTPPPAAAEASDAPPLEPPAHLTKLARPVPSPLHPRLRLLPAATVGGGVYCPNYGSPSLRYGRWCSSQIYLSLDGPFMNVHASLLFGDVLRYGALFGFELGTSYMQLGGKRSRVALALRGSFDLLIAGLGERVPGHYDDGLLGFSNTYGPHLSIALSPRAALEMRGAVGWTVGGFFSNHDGFDRPEYRFVAEGWVGVRVSP